MRWTIYYSLMICSLAATFWMVMNGSAEFWSNFFADEHNAVASHACSTAEHPTICVTKSSEPARAVAAPAQTEIRHIDLGTSRQDVLAMLGYPSLVDAVNDRWTYGTNVLMFKDDRVTGSLKIDSMQAARLHEAHMSSASMFDALAANTRGASQTMRKTAKKSTAATGMRKARSSKATLWEPMFRKFYSDTPMPRSQKHWTRYNGRPGYRDHRYAQPNTIYRRQ